MCVKELTLWKRHLQLGWLWWIWDARYALNPWRTSGTRNEDTTLKHDSKEYMEQNSSISRKVWSPIHKLSSLKLFHFEKMYMCVCAFWGSLIINTTSQTDNLQTQFICHSRNSNNKLTVMLFPNDNKNTQEFTTRCYYNNTLSTVCFTILSIIWAATKAIQEHQQNTASP